MIRKPYNHEALDCVKLLYISGPDLYSYIFIEQEPEIYNLLNLFFKNPGIYSKENIFIFEENGIIKGLLLGYPAEKMKKMSNKMLFFIKDILLTSGILNFFKMMKRFKLNSFFPKLEKDEFFISNLAVFDNFRNQGIAKRLLKKAEEIAYKKGLKKLSLYLETDNDIAKKVYQKYGFTEETHTILPANYKKYNLFGFYKMVKAL